MSSYKYIAASTTGGSLAGAGQVGRKGNLLKRLHVSVATAATGTVTLLDGAISIVITPANTPIGFYTVEFDAPSQSGAWTVTTGAGASVIAVGDFG